MVERPRRSRLPVPKPAGRAVAADLLVGRVASASPVADAECRASRSSCTGFRGRSQEMGHDQDQGIGTETNARADGLHQRRPYPGHGPGFYDVAAGGVRCVLHAGETEELTSLLRACRDCLRCGRSSRRRSRDSRSRRGAQAKVRGSAHHRFEAETLSRVPLRPARYHRPTLPRVWRGVHGSGVGAHGAGRGGWVVARLSVCAIAPMNLKTLQRQRMLNDIGMGSATGAATG
jgi:hypothetical protein